MIDEELAEKWVKENCDDSLYSFRGQELQEAFLAGLKAGRPQWHKVTDWEDNSQFPIYHSNPKDAAPRVLTGDCKVRIKK